VSEIPRQDLTLLDLLHKTGPLPEPILGSILTQLVAIIERLHLLCGCVHNDMDARNVYICANSGIVRVSNFFFAQFPKQSPGSDIKANGGSGNKIQRFLGPLLHQSPERMLGLECSFPSDIYSLGFMIRLLLTGELPVDLQGNSIQTPLAYKTIVCDGHRLPLKVDPAAYSGTSESVRVDKRRSMKKVLDHSSGDWKQSWKSRCSRFEKTAAAKHYSKELSELVEDCMQKNPEMRPTAVELGDHPFITRCKLTMGLGVELKAFLKLQKCKIHGINTTSDYDERD